MKFIKKIFSSKKKTEQPEEKNVLAKEVQRTNPHQNAIIQSKDLQLEKREVKSKIKSRSISSSSNDGSEFYPQAKPSKFKAPNKRMNMVEDFDRKKSMRSFKIESDAYSHMNTSVNMKNIMESSNQQPKRSSNYAQDLVSEDIMDDYFYQPQKNAAKISPLPVANHFREKDYFDDLFHPISSTTQTEIRKEIIQEQKIIPIPKQSDLLKNIFSDSSGYSSQNSIEGELEEEEAVGESKRQNVTRIPKLSNIGNNVSDQPNQQIEQMEVENGCINDEDDEDFINMNNLIHLKDNNLSNPTYRSIKKRAETIQHRVILNFLDDEDEDDPFSFHGSGLLPLGGVKRKRNELSSQLADANQSQTHNTFEITLRKGKKIFVSRDICKDVAVQNSAQFSNTSSTNSLSLTTQQSISYSLGSAITSMKFSSMISSQKSTSLAETCMNVLSFSLAAQHIQHFHYEKQQSLLHHRKEDFRFVTKIGRGSFGEVDLYEYLPLNLPVAAKSIKNVEEFARELYLMETLQSRYMPQLIYYDETKLQLFMELGLCSLEDLRVSLVQRGVRLKDDQALGIFGQIVIAVEVLLEQNAFHSDLKPQNIMLRSRMNDQHVPTLEIMLIDFGGASFDIEDYWIYYTPAFVCRQLWEKLTHTQRENEEQVIVEEALERLQTDEQKPSRSNDKDSRSGINNIPMLKHQQGPLMAIPWQTESNSSSYNSLKMQNMIVQEQLQQPHFGQGIQNKSKQLISEERLKTFRTEGRLRMLSSKNGEKQMHTSRLDRMRNAWQKANEQSNTQQQQLQQPEKKKIQNNPAYNSIEVEEEEAAAPAVVEAAAPATDSSKSTWLSWEEIRFSEVYAAARCMQNLMLPGQSDQDSELFLKQNIPKFLQQFQAEYPKTIAILDKILMRNHPFAMSKMELTQLFNQSSEGDFEIRMDPDFVFSISPAKRSLDSMANPYQQR